MTKLRKHQVREWTAEEEQKLRDMIEYKKTTEIAIILNRLVADVRIKVKALKLKRFPGRSLHTRKRNYRLHYVLTNMYRRCYDKTFPGYEDYGSKGVKICDQWNQDIVGRWRACENFVAWALDHGYKPELTIERKDPFGNYSPENCCWIRRALQGINKRKPKKSKFFGVTTCGKKWLAFVAIKGRCKRIGLFQDEEEAARAYNAFVKSNDLIDKELNFGESY